MGDKKDRVTLVNHNTVSIHVTPEGVAPDEIQLSDKFILQMSKLSLAERVELLKLSTLREHQADQDIIRCSALLAKRGKRAQQMAASLKKAEELYSKTNDALMAALAKQAVAAHSVKYINECVRASEKTVTELSEREVDTYYDSAAKLLSVYGKFLDSSIPIQISLEERSPNEIYDKGKGAILDAHNPPNVVSITFGIRDLDIRTTDGRWAGYSFGNFLVNISIKGWGAFQVVYVTMEPKGIHTKGQVHETFLHPHLNASFSVCVGNSGIQMLKAANARNLMTVVHLFLDTITQYNPKSPYETLSGWVSNTDDHGFCACGEHTPITCPIPTCPGCGAIPGPQQACNYCASCCQRGHVWDPVTAISKEGINHSGCRHHAFASTAQGEAT